ncbi:MAG TPA: uroporphyrinogen decarboxylase family protein [Candidatus Hydrogenedentes bacterium]|nr:uroporphyrinogen decarboxylase family protein [Candidatus Hydrogenedentota bacterium]HOT50303.1 uroporphyrinogen decarboxylase family protein [Candidatus Hydrogenedentota bacterium]HOV74401.1 uroporphyrinogen decarboxylase family protein [Candidatus Hydrogenedentota bacterium]HPC16659.1 uroporphyrinogen decarboxylase family protein [Candidatus Hydrogenedentota bacterium]HRT21209.1 uroporphyrinogen decarboxylase family protein [Candidatus Hydrogenedentota bacterium]
MKTPFSVAIEPDWRGLLDAILRTGRPKRVHFIELFLDPEVSEALASRYGILDDLNPSDPYYTEKREVAIQSFLGYDYVRCSLRGMDMPLNYSNTKDTADLARRDGRQYVDEHKGPVTTWEEFERYPWPDPEAASSRSLEWYEAHLPENMCVIGSGGFAHFAEYITWLMGYETLCFALCEQRDLVEAIARRLVDSYRIFLKRLLAFDRVKIVWGSDDMGYRGGPLIGPDDLRAFVLPGHKLMAEMSHAAGRPYLLHACGNLSLIMDDLLDDVRIDGKHSFEDTIERVTDAKDTYGRRIALLGGIDVDFLCRASESDVRRRVRETLEKCMPGGGYVLGTGNSVANYIPLDNYLAMLDEGRKFSV